ncbi:MAG: replication initiation protein [Lachnospiraceae bacterium]|nr:replication initiation protein [Lachnospiraceae bacterium]
MGENKNNSPLEKAMLVKSNTFTTAKYGSSLLENKLMEIALTRIEEDKNGDLKAELYPSELSKLLSNKANVYRDLLVASKKMMGRSILMEDGKGNFRAFSVVPNADYIDGVFTIKFNSVLKDHILELESNYTTFELSQMMAFSKNSTFRLYEILKKEAYKIPNIKNGFIECEYNISELRFIIGLADMDDESVQYFLERNGRKDIDWDQLFDVCEKKKYTSWGEFRRCVLIPAQVELEEKSDIKFDFEGIRCGKKMGRIVFRIYNNMPSNLDVIDEKKRILDMKKQNNRQLEMPFDNFPELYDEFCGHNELGKEDIDLLLKKAGYEEQTVRDAIALADKQGVINNYVGWLIKCIEDGYTKTVVIDGSSEKGEQAQQLQNYVEENSEEIAHNVWLKIMQKEDFPKFVQAIEHKGLSFENYDAIYDDKEKGQMFVDFKLGKGINI